MMSQNITRRMMQAEEEANADIAAKSYQHTAAYQQISDDTQSIGSTQPLSGDAIRSALLRRARAKELGLDALGYNSSNLSQGLYRTNSFEEGDDHARKTALGVAGAKKRREHDRHKRSSHRTRRQQFNATGSVEEHTPESPSPRQEFNSRRSSFNEPPGRSYNPYA